MSFGKQVNVYDPEVGACYMSVSEAAKYLGYLEFSVRRAIVKGKIKPYGKVGNKWMILKDELDRFRASNPWAARKAGKQTVKDLPPPPPSTLKATVSLDISALSLSPVGLEPIERFAWEQLPLLRARIHKTHGDIPFSVSVQSPDGGVWQIDYQPPTWLERIWKRMREQ